MVFPYYSCDFGDSVVRLGFVEADKLSRSRETGKTWIMVEDVFGAKTYLDPQRCDHMTLVTEEVWRAAWRNSVEEAKARDEMEKEILGPIAEPEDNPDKPEWL